MIAIDELYKSVRENLTEGQTIKNYKELCSTLNMHQSTGATKKRQLENLRRYLEYEKSGQKFIITKIYDIPIEKKDNRIIGNRQIYVKYIETILLNYFINQNKTECNFRKKELWKMLGMINENFLLYDSDTLPIEKLQEYDGKITQWQINDFFNRVYPKLIQIAESALKNLAKRKLIIWKEVIVACYTHPTYGTRMYFEVKDSEDLENILKIEYESLHELDCNNIQELFFNKNKAANYKAYANIRNEKLNRKFGWNFIFKRYSIVCNREYLERGLQENEQELLNAKVIEAVDRQADKRYKKNSEKYRNGLTTFKYPWYYPQIQKYLSQKLLSINENPDIIDSLADDIEINRLFDVG